VDAHYRKPASQSIERHEDFRNGPVGSPRSAIILALTAPAMHVETPLRIGQVLDHNVRCDIHHSASHGKVG
jgi:hypothetical protein